MKTDRMGRKSQNKFNGIEIKSREKEDPLAQVCWHGPGENFWYRVKRRKS